jgi:Lon protease-like protein
MEKNQPFGIVLFEGQYMRSVGCMARVTEVTKLYADGRMDIVTRGEKRFIIQKVIDEKPYLEAHVNFFEDIDKPNPDELQTVVENIRFLLDELYEMDQSSHHYRMMAQSSLLKLSFAIAALEGFTPAERQRFLEMTSSSERIIKGAEALTKLAQRIRLTNEINRIIGGNGNPPKQLINLIGQKKQG